MTQVTNHVPMHRRVVLSARLRIAHAARHVHRAADLLVEQDLLGASGDAVVGADPELAQPAGALVGVEHLVQELLALLGRRLHHLAALEAEANAGDLAAAVGGGERERHLALDRVLDRAGEELAVRHVVLADAGDPGPLGHAELDVRAGRGDPHLLLALDPLGQPVDLVGLALPGRDRLGVRCEAGPVVEVLVVGQRHPRLARVRVRREERQRPAVLPGGRAVHRGLHERLAGLLRPRLALGVRPRELARVDVGHDRDPHVGVLGGPGGRWRDPLELLVRGEVVERGGRPLRGELHDREPARPQHLLVDGLHEGLRAGGGLDDAYVALRHPGRVAHQDAGQGVYARVLHSGSPPLDRPTSQRWRRSSPVSSGWKATARTLPCRTATGCPSTSASTSTSGPCSSTQGARMTTARSGPKPSSSRSDSKLCVWRPNALRRALTSSSPRWSRSSMIRPAQVPSVGVPPRISSRSGSASRSRSMPLVIVVDSPPGITSPSSPCRSSRVRTLRTSAPTRCRLASWASKSPWMASTPMVAMLTSRAAEAGRRTPRGRRSRGPPWARPAHVTPLQPAPHPRSGSWPPRSPGRAWPGRPT